MDRANIMLLLLSTAASASAAAFTQATSAQYRMVSSALEQTAVNEFFSCLNNHTTIGGYKAGVDNNGFIVISPTASRVIDFKGADQGLASCMSSVAATLKTAAQSTLYGGNFDDGEMVAIPTATFGWLKAQGAEGQTKEANVPTKTMDTPAPDSTDYYNFYYTDDTDCSNEDLVHSNYATCYTKSQAWYSMQWENFSEEQDLEISIWPHHNCAKGDETTYLQSPNTISTCVVRKKGIYSYAADLTDSS